MAVAAPFVLPSLLLTLVLIVSATFKLRDSSTTADAFASLRLPVWLRRLNGPVLLPYAELVLAVALLVIPSPAYVVVTVVVALLFIAYLVVILRALGFEEHVECGCFGRLGLGEVDRFTALRNALLVVLALVAVGDALAGHSVIHRLTSFGGAEWTWLLGVLVAVLLTWLIVGRRGESTRAATAFAHEADQLDYQRQPIPYGALRDRGTGEASALFAVGGGGPALLVFLNETCGACLRTMEVLPEWAERHALLRTIAVPAVEGAAELPDLGANVSWMDDPGATVARTFGVGYPAAVLLGADGLLAGGPESGFDDISAFLGEISEQLTEAGVLPEVP